MCASGKSCPYVSLFLCGEDDAAIGKGIDKDCIHCAEGTMMTDRTDGDTPSLKQTFSLGIRLPGVERTSDRDESAVDVVVWACHCDRELSTVGQGRVSIESCGGSKSTEPNETCMREMC